MKSKLIDIKGEGDDKVPVAPKYLNYIVLFFYLYVISVIGLVGYDTFKHKTRMVEVNSILESMSRQQTFIDQNAKEIATFKKKSRMNDAFQNHLLTNLPMAVFEAYFVAEIQKYSKQFPDNKIFVEYENTYNQDSRTLRIVLDISGFKDEIQMQSDLTRILRGINRLSDQYYVDFGSFNKSGQANGITKFDLIYYLRGPMEEES